MEYCIIFTLWVYWYLLRPTHICSQRFFLFVVKFELLAEFVSGNFSERAREARKQIEEKAETRKTMSGYLVAERFFKTHINQQLSAHCRTDSS